VCLATLNFPSQAKFNFPFANLKKKKKHYLNFWRKTEAAWYDRDLIIVSFCCVFQLFFFLFQV
jgi:hypothetical protein